MNLFILVAGHSFDIPSKTTGNWIASYQTLDELNADIEEITEEGLICNNTYYKVICNNTYYKVRGQEYDWYEVINLDSWIFPK